MITRNTSLKNNSSYAPNQPLEDFIIHDAITVDQPELSDTMEFENDIKVSGIVNSRVSTNLNVTLYIEAKYCIKNIQYDNQVYSNLDTDKDSWLKIDLDLNADFDDIIPIEINMAVGDTYNIEVPLNKLKIPNNKPSAPTIDYWPLTTTIKNGRNVVLKAKDSVDEDGDNISYIWDGRIAETATYDVGTHTVKVKAIDEWGAESDWTSYSFTVINVTAATITYSVSSNNLQFNVWGNGTKTTYADAGYTVVFEPSNSNVTLTLNIEPIYDGNYIKINYVVYNPTSSSATYRIATHADIMINSNDKAPIYNLAGNKGFTMTDNTYYYNVYLADTEGVTNVSTYWYGLYSQRVTNEWSNGSRADLTNTDSGMAFSWQNKSINSGETQTLSIIIGLE